MKHLYIVLLLLTSFSVFSQTTKENNDSKFDFRFGSGWSLLGTGDYGCITFENELNYRISRYFTTSASIGLGRSVSGASDGSSSFIEGNLNIFISPFRNNRLNDFRIGAGMSVYNIYDSYLSSIYFYNGTEFMEYVTRKETSFGWTLIFEDTFTIKKRFLIGVKAYMQPFFNGDINSGITGKFGIRF